MINLGNFHLKNHFLLIFYHKNKLEYQIFQLEIIFAVFYESVPKDVEPKLQSFFQLDLESVYVFVMKCICRIGKWGWDIMNQTHNLEAKTLLEMDFPEGNPPHRPPWPRFFLG